MEEHALAQGKTFVWHELYAPSSEAAISFYTQSLGWETDSMPMGDMGTYTMFKANGTSVAGMMATAGNPQLANVPPQWSVYVGVDDVDARIAKCVELGGTVLVEPMDVPQVGRMALIQDPQGATFWLFKDAMA